MSTENVSISDCCENAQSDKVLEVAGIDSLFSIFQYDNDIDKVKTFPKIVKSIKSYKQFDNLIKGLIKKYKVDLNVGEFILLFYIYRSTKGLAILNVDSNSVIVHFEGSVLVTNVELKAKLIQHEYEVDDKLLDVLGLRHDDCVQAPVSDVLQDSDKDTTLAQNEQITPLRETTEHTTSDNVEKLVVDESKTVEKQQVVSVDVNDGSPLVNVPLADINFVTIRDFLMKFGYVLYSSPSCKDVYEKIKDICNNEKKYSIIIRGLKASEKALLDLLKGAVNNKYGIRIVNIPLIENNIISSAGKEVSIKELEDEFYATLRTSPYDYKAHLDVFNKIMQIDINYKGRVYAPECFIITPFECVYSDEIHIDDLYIRLGWVEGNVSQLQQYIKTLPRSMKDEYERKCNWYCNTVKKERSLGKMNFLNKYNHLDENTKRIMTRYGYCLGSAYYSVKINLMRYITFSGKNIVFDNANDVKYEKEYAMLLGNITKHSEYKVNAHFEKLIPFTELHKFFTV